MDTYLFIEEGTQDGHQFSGGRPGTSILCAVLSFQHAVGSGGGGRLIILSPSLHDL